MADIDRDLKIMLQNKKNLRKKLTMKEYLVSLIFFSKGLLKIIADSVERSWILFYMLTFFILNF